MGTEDTWNEATVDDVFIKSRALRGAGRIDLDRCIVGLRAHVLWMMEIVPFLITDEPPEQWNSTSLIKRNYKKIDKFSGLCIVDGIKSFKVTTLSTKIKVTGEKNRGTKARE